MRKIFGKMTSTIIASVDKRESLETAVARLLEATDHPDIARWIQFPHALLLFLIVPGDPDSGAFYMLDRRTGVWYWIDFEDEKFGGYSEADFEILMNGCRFARLVERPSLIRMGQWSITPGIGPQLLGATPA